MDNYTNTRKPREGKPPPKPGSIQGDLRNLPAALAPLVALPHWVNWRWELSKGGKWTKVPYRPSGAKAKSNVPSTWSSYDDVIRAVDRFDGIGIMVADIGAFDIDDCRDPEGGAIDPWAQQLVDEVGSYAEITVSGTGLRIIGLATGEEVHRKQPVANGVTLEAYRRTARYIVVTGNPLSGGPAQLINIDTRIDETVAKLDAKNHAKSKGKGKRSSGGAAAVGAIAIEALPVSPRIKNLIRGIDHPEHPYPSRSERVMAVLVAMVGQGCTEEQMAAIMREESLPIGGHIREQSDPERYLDRQIAAARKVATDLDVARLNENYALVMVGDKAAIMKATADEIKFLTVGAFNQWLANRHVWREDEFVPLAKHWMTHPQRRQYEGLVFAPGREAPNHFNLWRGFAVEPKAGDCSKFLSHLNDNVCRGDRELYLWVVGWFAQIVQQPDRKLGSSLVIRGKQGTGKTKVGEVFGSLFGDHYALVSDPRYVTGRFNSHLVSNLLLHCDEGFWAGDHAAEGKLKDLITGDHHYIEYKGKEPIRVRNYVRLLITGNPDWVVPAGFEERRFGVLDIGEDHMQDKPYFAAIDEEMNTGGREALLDFLLHFDLKAVDLRTIPKTAALLDQKLASLGPERAWWLDVLVRGELPWGCEEVGRCTTRSLFDRYIRHARKIGARRRSIETQLGMFLTKHVPGLQKVDGQYRVFSKAQNKAVNEYGKLYQFPTLRECRDAFVQALHQEFNWNEAQAWIHEPRADAEEEDEDF